jgi:hypothetical protein
MADINYMELIQESDQLTADLAALETTALEDLDKLDDAKEVLETRKADFYTKEHLIDVPGGPGLKWNDKRRDAYIAENSAQAIDYVKYAERDYRRTQSNIKIVSIKVSGLNRKIRLLELVAGISAPGTE